MTAPIAPGRTRSERRRHGRDASRTGPPIVQSVLNQRAAAPQLISSTASVMSIGETQPFGEESLAGLDSNHVGTATRMEAKAMTAPPRKAIPSGSGPQASI